MSRYRIKLVEGLAAIWAFSHSVRNAVLNTLLAKHMAACLQEGVLEVATTDSAKSKLLIPQLACKIGGTFLGVAQPRERGNK